MTAYTYYQSIGWNKIKTTEQLLIGLYNELNSTWSNDLWLQGVNENQLHQLLSKVTFKLNLDKYINTNLQPSSMTVHIDFYADLPAIIKGGYKTYSKDDIQDNLLGKTTINISSHSKWIGVQISPQANNKIYMPPGTFYVHIYTIATQAEDNNKIKAYISNLEYGYVALGYEEKAIVTYKYYYPNSSYISKIITETQYYNLKDGIKPNLESAPYVYENRSERVTGENTYLVKRVQKENLEITFIPNDNNITIDGQKLSYIEGYKVNAWIINGKNYGNANPLILTPTPELITGKNKNGEYYCEVKADVTPIIYSIVIPVLNKTYTFTITEKRSKWPSLSKSAIPVGLEFQGWKNSKTGTVYEADQDMPLESMAVYPAFNGEIAFIISGEEKRNLSYNPLGYYSLEPLTQGDRTIYAYTTDINEKGVPIGPVYSIYEIMDTKTFNSRFKQEQKLYPLTHEVIKGNPLAVQKKNTNEWSTEMEGYLYQKTKEGVWKRVN